MTLQDAIALTVNAHGPIKSVELALNVMSIIGPSHFNEQQYLVALYDVMSRNEFIKVEYRLHQEMGTNFIIFPRGATIYAYQKQETTNRHNV